jgi:AraC-like DNA-binding protein
VLPHVEELDPDDLISILRRSPSQLGVEVTEYLLWRGVEVDIDTRRLLRKTLELSGELRTVSGLARALYMSRRALGRRFMSRQLPVPSHWLHFGRVLRGSLRLQHPNANLFSIGCELGYPDGFAFSNQMKRLTGLRPSLMRECFGWEWIVESWLFQEAKSGGLSSGLVGQLYPSEGSDPEKRNVKVAAQGSRRPESGMRVAEDNPSRSRKEEARGQR